MTRRYRKLFGGKINRRLRGYKMGKVRSLYFKVLFSEDLEVFVPAKTATEANEKARSEFGENMGPFAARQCQPSELPQLRHINKVFRRGVHL